MRMQVLHLPGPVDEWPFVLIVDQVLPPFNDSTNADAIEQLRDQVGAKAVLVFRGTIEVV